MKLTAQTINREFYTYSKPITKLEANKLLCRILEGSGPEFREKMAIRLTNAMPDDQLFIKHYNKFMNIKLTSYAPGLFRIRYDNSLVLR